MAPITTPALILHAFRYGETSKIVRLLTRDLGLQSAIAKGALRPKGKFGARLQVLSEGTAQLYVKPTRELQTLVEFDIVAQHEDLAHDVRRYAAATALAELVLRFAPAESHPALYDLVTAGLVRLTDVPATRLDVTALALLWATVGALGFAPSIQSCARCGGKLPAGAATFSVADGGLLCAMCAADNRKRVLKREDRTMLAQLVLGANEPVTSLSPKQVAAHRRLLVEFIEQHVAEGRELTGIAFWVGQT